jgi:hypothetical protein
MIPSARRDQWAVAPEQTSSQWGCPGDCPRVGVHGDRVAEEGAWRPPLTQPEPRYFLQFGAEPPCEVKHTGEEDGPIDLQRNTTILNSKSESKIPCKNMKEKLMQLFLHILPHGTLFLPCG